MHSGVSFAGLVTRVLTDRPPSRQRGRSEGVDRCDIATPGAREQFGVEQRSNRSFWTHSALPITDWGGCNLGQTTVTLLWRKIVARIPSPSPTLARSQRALTTGCRFAPHRRSASRIRHWCPFQFPAESPETAPRAPAIAPAAPRRNALGPWHPRGGTGGARRGGT